MRLIESHDAAFEATRGALIWNGRRPARRPDAIAQARDAADVVAAVKLARERGCRLSVRSGGHNFVANSVRDGGLVLDVSALDGVEVDPARRRAVVGPGCKGEPLLARLREHGLAFGVGHCPSVAVGGFLLGGGMGFNPGAWGYGCESVAGVDVVLADGRLVHANADQHADLYWAARGAGPAFFGVVVAYHLDLAPDPRALATSTYIHPLDALPALTDWLFDYAGHLDPVVEPMIWIGNLDGHTVGALDGAGDHGTAGGHSRVALLNAVAFAETPQRAQAALTALDACPAPRISADVARPCTFTDLFDFQRVLYPPGLRYAVDCQWTDAPPSRQPLAALIEHLRDAPSPRTHALWQLPFANYRGELPDMAASHLGKTFVSFYTVWEDPADDTRNERWLREATGLLDPISTGHYAGDVDLTAAPSRARRTLSRAHWERLQELRDRYDAERLFQEPLTPTDRQIQAVKS